MPLSFNNDSLDLAQDFPIWLNEKYITDHHLEEEILEDDINITVEQSHSSRLQFGQKSNDDDLLRTDLSMFLQFSCD